MRAGWTERQRAAGRAGAEVPRTDLDVAPPHVRAPGPMRVVPLEAGGFSLGDVSIGPLMTAMARIGAVGSPDLRVPAAGNTRPGTLDATQLIGLLGDVEALRSALAAVEARAIVALEAAVLETAVRDAAVAPGSARPDSDVERPGGRRPSTSAEASRIAAREVSVVLRRSPAMASGRLSTSRRLVRDLPRMLAHLARGTISPEAAHAIGRAAGPVPRDVRPRIDAALDSAMPYLEGAGLRQWSDEVEALAHQLDPGSGVERHERARRERGVVLRRGAHGMATLAVRVPAVDAALARKRLSLEAERLTVLGDRRGHQQIMADCLIDTVIGRSETMDPVTLDLGVIITDRSLLAPRHGGTAVVEGYGVVPFSAVRHCLRDALVRPARGEEDRLGPDGDALRAVYRRLWTHPRSGELVAVEARSRAFPPALRRAVLWRDGSCRGPYCDAEIRQIDHVRPHAEGGPTTLDNANGLCAACNQKETFTRSVTVERRVRWVTALGQEIGRGPLSLVARPVVGDGSGRSGQDGAVDGDVDQVEGLANAGDPATADDRAPNSFDREELSRSRGPEPDGVVEGMGDGNGDDEHRGPCRAPNPDDPRRRAVDLAWPVDALAILWDPIAGVPTAAPRDSGDVASDLLTGSVATISRTSAPRPGERRRLARRGHGGQTGRGGRRTRRQRPRRGPS